MIMNFHIFYSGAFLDKSGVAFSWICAVHCLGLPFVISLLPAAGLSFLETEIAEYIFLSISVAIGLISLIPAYLRRHKQIRTILLFVSGVGLIVFADALFENSITGQALFLTAGAAAITASHIINRRLCKSCESCREIQSRSLP